MNSFLDPVGARPAPVYWRRRAIMLAALAVTLLLLARACSSGGPPDLTASGEREPVPLLSTYTPTPEPTVLEAGEDGVPGYQAGAPAGRAGAAPADPTAGGPAGAAGPGDTRRDSGAAGLAGLEPDGVAGAGAEAAGPPAAVATVPGAPAGTPAPAPAGDAAKDTAAAGSSASPSPVSDAEAAGPAPCAKKALAVQLRTDQDVYSGKEKPKLYIGVRNTGDQACLANLGSKALTLTVVSGEDRIWSSDDCQGKGLTDIRLLQPGKTMWARSVWSTVRSEPGCPKGMSDAQPGYYILDGSAKGVDAKKRVVFRLA